MSSKIDLTLMLRICKEPALSRRREKGWWRCVMIYGA